MLGIAPEQVARTTATLFHVLTQALSDGYRIHLDGFGNFELLPFEKKYRNKEGSTIEFQPIWKTRIHLGNHLKKDYSGREGGPPMDKYGVDEAVHDPEQLEKMAHEGCPLCGKKPERHGNTLLCPTHGAEPFERENGTNR